ncbi:hypothetical protein Rhopal_007712-T1 [Rhodotorula paludigena]|uniref:Uncharacterized protein n=1 Tax=Rhodotorula paludigena TaxID=86838 RepID=A0AAV5GVQ4_9BASI|nr:hypothetical protein Rhopal_007712-T1 [Rhodotorula paludigena]
MASWLVSRLRREPAPYLPLATSQSQASTPFLYDCGPPSRFTSPAIASLGRFADDEGEEEKPYVNRLQEVPPWSPDPTAIKDDPAAPRAPEPILIRRLRRVLALLLAVVLLAGIFTISTTELLKHAKSAVNAGWYSFASSSALSAALVSAKSTSPAQSERFPVAFAPACNASTWSSGRWVAREPPFSPNASVWTVSPSLGRYLGLVAPDAAANSGGSDAEWPMSAYRRRAADWVWEAGSETCRNEVEAPWERLVEGEDDEEGIVNLLQDLIDRGGWLIAGDSLSEQHFYSLGCILFPHVRAVWPFPVMSMGQIKEEHLVLDAEGPLVQSGLLRVPEDWDFDGRPLVSFLRTDHGFSATELLDLHSSLVSSVNDTSAIDRYPALLSLAVPSPDLLTPTETYSPSIEYLLSLFLHPSAHRNITSPLVASYAPRTVSRDAWATEQRTTRSAEYRALIFSTGQHFSTRHFALPAEATAPSRGNAQLELFEYVLRAWMERVQTALGELGAEERRGKEVIVRATSNGHDACKEASAPVEEVDANRSTWYNWRDAARTNDIAKGVLAGAAHPQISFLDISRPAALRPDAHTNQDCLHNAVGTGVVEGWTRYLAYWLHERALWLDELNEDKSSSAAKWWDWLSRGKGANW